MASAPPSRAGVAQVAAYNVGNPEVSKTCVKWLVPMFADDDADVRLQASSWVSQLGKTGINRLREVATAYIDSPAYLDDEAPMLHALDSSTTPIAELAQLALQRFIEHREHEMGEIQHASALSASIASKLAIRAYTSAPTTAAREAALDAIDSLLAAKVSEMTTFVETFG